ncbi:hypothetical protein GCM10027082_24280 [Comamonas humi]
MTYRNRALVRKPSCMLRANETEQADLDFLVDEYGGGEPSAVLREILLEVARQKRHERNSLSHRRLDRNAFGSLMAA